MYDFSDFIFTCEDLISAILGKFKFEELVVANPILGPIFFFLFMGSMTYILINMFLTIVNEAFKVCMVFLKLFLKILLLFEKFFFF